MARINIAHGVNKPVGLGVAEPWLDDATGMLYIGGHPITGSNPNMLCNWDFRNPVNQRGLATYPALPRAWQPCVDGWGTFNVVTTVSDGYISVVSDVSVTDNKRILQVTGENGKAGETYTASMRIRVNALSGNVFLRITHTRTGIVQTKLTPNAQWHTITCTAELSEDYPSLGMEILAENNIDSQFDMDIAKAKLERGPISTLALDGPADYAAELAKCQRYYFDYGGRVYLPGMSNNVGAFFCAIVDMPTAMRTTPTVIAGEGIQLDIGGTRISGTIAYSGIVASSNRQCVLKYTPTTTIPADHGGVILVSSLALSAEL